MTTDRRWRLAGLLVLLASATPLAWHYLGSYPREIWQIDLEVYREGARALVAGQPLYDLRTEAPQFLPFTYPPFAAVAGLPLLLAPFTTMGWIWTGLQVLLLWAVVGRSFGPFLARFGARAGLVQGVVAGALIWALPVSDNFRYGQVNMVIVALCLFDVTAGPDRRLPRGVLVGLATAVKLTPGVFWVFWLVVRDRRSVLISIGTAAFVTVWSALVQPAASAAYWADALLAPDRLGPNGGTSNQSLRGVLLRIGPETGWLPGVLWLVCAVPVAVLGLRLAARLHRAGDLVAVVATVGMVAFLVSPVSWVHHLFWGVVVLGAVLGDGRDRRRVAAVLAGAAMLWMRLPWWGANMAAFHQGPEWFARVVQNAYCLFGLLALLALWRLVLPAAGPAVEPEPETEPATVS
jgi:alpha-1,2-mannosyltransferase